LSRRRLHGRVGLEINEAIHEVIALTHGEAVKNRVSVHTRLSDALPLVQEIRSNCNKWFLT